MSGHAVITTFLAEKHRKVALSRALRDPMAEIDGVEIMQDAARHVISELAMLVAGQIGRSLTANEHHRLALTVSAVEGAVTALISTRPDALLDTETHGALIRMFRAGLGSFHWTVSAFCRRRPSRSDMPRSFRRRGRHTLSA